MRRSVGGLVLVVVLVAGCGDDGGGGLSDDEYRDGAGVACVAAVAGVEADVVATRYDLSSDDGTLLAVERAQAAGEVLSAQLETLRGIEAPPDAEEEHAALVAALEDLQQARIAYTDAALNVSQARTEGSEPDVRAVDDARAEVEAALAAVRDAADAEGIAC